MNEIELVQMIARLMKDGECQSCHEDPSEPNPACADHREWDGWENDDAYETLHSLISDAREIVARKGDGQ